MVSSGEQSPWSFKTGFSRKRQPSVPAWASFVQPAEGRREDQKWQTQMEEGASGAGLASLAVQKSASFLRRVRYADF